MGPGKVRVVEDRFRRVADNRPVPMVGGGAKPWQVVDVRDVSELTARIIEQALRAPARSLVTPDVSD